MRVIVDAFVGGRGAAQWRNGIMSAPYWLIKAEFTKKSFEKNSTFFFPHQRQDMFIFTPISVKKKLATLETSFQLEGGHVKHCAA